jgi:hypothetical protein
MDMAVSKKWVKNPIRHSLSQEYDTNNSQLNSYYNMGFFSKAKSFLQLILVILLTWRGGKKVFM